LLSKLIGERAQNGDYAKGRQLQKGLYLSSQKDPRTSEQVILRFDMDVSGDAETTQRLLSRVPASFKYRKTFTAIVRAAIAQTNERLDAGETMLPWRLEYRTRSAKGGKLTLAVVFNESNETYLKVEGQTPLLSLEQKDLYEPATKGKPFDTIYGKVFFDLSRDDFNFFARRAYGISAGAEQNFKDFFLMPHAWLQLTVEPKLDKDIVQVNFDVMTEDDRRIRVAKAPASLKGGEQFMQTVFRMVDNMKKQEAEQEGSSVPFEVPFYYDDPKGGGIVEVIASGEEGNFNIAYAIETPKNFLRDVEPVQYQGGVEIPDDWGEAETTCEELDTEPANRGKFDIKFAASAAVRNSNKLDQPLKGPVQGAIYRAKDVRVSGPIDGAEPVAKIDIDQVDLTDGPSQRHLIDKELLAGKYQVLGALDFNDNSKADVGEPVMIPVGAFELKCKRHPVTAEFAILRPDR
jgi:hypothetical protein